MWLKNSNLKLNSYDHFKNWSTISLSKDIIAIPWYYRQCQGSGMLQDNPPPLMIVLYLYFSKGSYLFNLFANHLHVLPFSGLTIMIFFDSPVSIWKIFLANFYLCCYCSFQIVFFPPLFYYLYELFKNSYHLLDQNSFFEYYIPWDLVHF